MKLSPTVSSQLSDRTRDGGRDAKRLSSLSTRVMDATSSLLLECELPTVGLTPPPATPGRSPEIDGMDQTEC
jgi:hypothetical protein